MPDTDTPGEVARFYTRARKFPKLIGRLHDGTRIPGGPYTISQLVTLVVLTTGAMLTRGIWGSAVLFDLIVSLTVGIGGAFALGLLPSQQRNLLSITNGLISATGSSASGRYRGKTVQVRAPSHATGRVAINTPPVADPEPVGGELVPQGKVAVSQEKQAVVPARPVVASGVERLLLQTRK